MKKKNVIVIAALAVFFIVAVSASAETKQQQVPRVSTELPAGKYYFSLEGSLQACALGTTYYELPACPNPDEVELFTSPEKGFFDRLKDRQRVLEEITRGTR